MSLLFSMTVQLAFAETKFIERKDCQAFIQMMIKKHHVKKKQLISIFNNIQIRPQIMHHMNKPLEKEPWHKYKMLFVTNWRIRHGVKFWDKYANSLSRAEKQFGVPASIIVATIGIETKYGTKSGSFRVIDSLANIAFSNSPRAAFFRQELEAFLLLTQEQHLNPLKIMGSYAGAIGQPQFMPSSYRRYAINFSKSGKIDLINNEIDVIGSIANYYQKKGWLLNQQIAMPARIIGDRYHYLSSKNKIRKPLKAVDLIKYGIVSKYKITPENQTIKVVALQNHFGKEYWLGFHNFEVIRRYNTSDLYAIAVFQLSQAITTLRKQQAHE